MSQLLDMWSHFIEMLSHFEPGVKIYIFVAIRKFGPYLYKSVRPGGGGWGGHIQINMQDLGEVREGGELAYNGVWTQSCKKGCSMATMLPEGNRQDHFLQKDFGQIYNICHIFT